MNRDFKFRLWDGDKFIYDPIIHDNEYYANFRDFEDAIPTKGYKVLQQYTGMEDSNGKSIYEGDIVYAKKPNSYLDGNFEVYYSENKGRWAYKGCRKMYQVGSGGNLHCQVIGNIFENKDLL